MEYEGQYFKDEHIFYNAKPNLYVVVVTDPYLHLPANYTNPPLEYLLFYYNLY